ncbi:MAG: amidohydrolase family protein [Prevotellaceae bacterium]|jgi:N-acyl-D-amino-acid deacylase|nr:amidohydrolase family protein [Prevotellaceae bacterium]
MLTRRKFLQTSAVAGAALGLGISNPLQARAKAGGSASFDVLIKNGLIYTGDGRAPIAGDLGIKDGKIAAIGNLGDTADQLVEANGRAVSPGFIDIHTHTDDNLLQCPAGDSKLFQGVTTDVGGNCGSGPFLGSYANADEFFAALETKKIGINYASFTGQGDLRSIVVGDNAVEATPAQITKMQEILAKQLEMGSIGMSSGLEYTPGSYASNDELVELCKVVAQYNGLFAIHMRNEDDFVEESVQESIDIARRSGVRLQISHLKAQNAANWHKAPLLLKMIDNAVASGVDVAFDRYPYTAFSTGLSSFVPLEERQGSRAEILARLKDPQKGKEIAHYGASRIERLGGPQNVVITSSRQAQNKQYIGKNLTECALMANMEVQEFVHYLLISENMGVNIIGFAMAEENLKLLFAHRLGMPASDGSVYSPQGPLSNSMPHPRSYGTFPRFLGTYIREQKVVDLQTAVYKMCALPASRLGLKDRGLLIPGYRADVVIFNPQTVCELSTYAEPHQFNKGIDHVFVNGVWTVKEELYTGTLAGEVVRLG